MSQNFDLIDTFAEHETIVFEVAAKNRAGAALASPGTATLEFVITSDANRDVQVVSLAFGSEMSLTDAGTATFQIRFSDASRDALTPGSIYYFDCWSVDATNGRLHQVDGIIRLKRAAKAI